MTATQPTNPVRENPIPPHHRNVAGGPARAAIFGVSDGLVTNVAMVLAFAGADASQGVVRLAGLAGLIAGSVSMAAGEWVSMQAQKELLQRELDQERIELKHRPELEKQELAALYIQRGIPEELADRLSAEIMTNPEVALEVHAREELGVDPNSLGSPPGAAASSFLTFAGGAIVPLVPWLFGGGTAATVWSVALSAVMALCVGALLGHFTDRNISWSAFRQLLLTAVAAGFTYVIGAVVGVGVS